MDEYISKATTTKISAVSRASVKIGDSYYTFEFSAEKHFTNPDADVNVQLEKDILWEECHAEVDRQIEDISNYLKKKK